MAGWGACNCSVYQSKVSLLGGGGDPSLTIVVQHCVDAIVPIPRYAHTHMGRSQGLLLLRSLLLGLQLCPILFCVDLALTECCRLLCKCFTFVGLNDTTWLDTVISCTVDVSLDAVLPSAAPKRTSRAPKRDECKAFYTALYNILTPPRGHDIHFVLTLARASTSLLCWCTLFAALSLLGALKARLLRRITSRRWWRAKRALLQQPNGTCHGT